MRHDQIAVHGKIYSSIDVLIGAPSANEDLMSWKEGLQAEAAESNRRIRQDVIAELRSEPTIDAAHIGVQVSEGIVTLTGRVDGYGDQWMIEAAVQRVAGVKGLEVALKINQPEPDMRTDDGLRRECEQALGMTLPCRPH